MPKTCSIRLDLTDLKKRAEENGNTDYYNYVIEKLGNSQQTSSLRSSETRTTRESSCNEDLCCSEQEITASVVECNVVLMKSKGDHRRSRFSSSRRGRRSMQSFTNWEHLDESQTEEYDDESSSSFALDFDYSSSSAFDLDDDVSMCSATTATTMGTDSMRSSVCSDEALQKSRKSRSKSPSKNFLKFWNDKRRNSNSNNSNNNDSSRRKNKKEKSVSQRKKQLRMRQIELMHSDAIDVSVAVMENKYDNLNPIVKLEEGDNAKSSSLSSSFTKRRKSKKGQGSKLNLSASDRSPRLPSIFETKLET